MCLSNGLDWHKLPIFCNGSMVVYQLLQCVLYKISTQFSTLVGLSRPFVKWQENLLKWIHFANMYCYVYYSMSSAYWSFMHDAYTGIHTDVNVMFSMWIRIKRTRGNGLCWYLNITLTWIVKIAVDDVTTGGTWKRKKIKKHD